MKRTAPPVAILVAAVLLVATSAGAYEPLPRDSAEQHQVDAQHLAAAFDAADALNYVRSMVVVRDGHVIGEEQWSGSPSSLHDSRSVTKSVMSILIGIATEKGFIEDGPTARMVDYLPDDLIPSDPAKHEIQIWHLLTMSAGFEWNDDTDLIPWLNGPDPVAAILARPLAAPPGTLWNYNTAASHLLSVILTEATGMGTLEFADTYLFGPLGISERSWVHTGGYPNGGLGLRVRTEDLAKFGVLYVDGGSWNGERVVSRFWVNLSTSNFVNGIGSFGPLTEIGYGFLWWLDGGTGYDVFTGWGYGGQFVFCVPALRLVVAVHSRWEVGGATADQQEAAILDIIVNQILPATTDRRRFAATGQAVPELAAVDDMIQDIMQTNNIRDTTAAIANDGRLVYARGFTWGEPDVDPVQPTALFRTASIGKAITSVAIHQLIESGLLDYTTHVNSILNLQPLPGHDTDPRLDQVTVDHLLTHTSGLYSEDNVYEVSSVVARELGVGPPHTSEELAGHIVGHPFNFDPETDWDYNNYGYMMLDMMLRRVTGQHFVEYVQDKVFRPVGVGRARRANVAESELSPTEVNYDGLEGDPFSAPIDTAVAAGGWVMAAPDMARLFSALFDDADASGLLLPATRQEMLTLPFQPCVNVGYGRGWIDESLFFIEGHAAGWLIDLDDGLDVHAHTGGGTGVQTIALWRDDGITFVLLSNKDPVFQDLDFPEITAWPDHDLWASVGVSTDPVGAAPTEVWIPVVASSDGVGSSVWRSDVGLLNRSTLANSVRLRLYGNGEPVDRELGLEPGEFRAIVDVMSEFQATGSAPLRVFSSEPLTVTSRTYNLASDGTFGQFIDSSTPTAALQTGDQTVLMQLKENPSFRTNIGLHNGWGRPAEVEIALFDGDSLPVASFTETVPARSTIQINRPFRTVGGRSDITSGYAVVSVLFGQEVVVYGSVIDNLTDDPTTVPMKYDPGVTDQWVAAAASTGGAQGSVWRTDLAVLNRSGEAATAEVRYRSDDGGAGTAVVVLLHGEQRTLTDVVGGMDMTGGGSLEVFSDRPVLVSSRTYSTSDAGTYGQFLDGTASAETADQGQTVWLPQLRQNESFRTNIGFLNTADLEAAVRVRLFDASGQLLAVRLRALPARSRLQLQEPFYRIAGRDDIAAGYASVTVESGGGVIAYASVIDNATNDPTTVPMEF